MQKEMRKDSDLQENKILYTLIIVILVAIISGLTYWSSIRTTVKTTKEYELKIDSLQQTQDSLVIMVKNAEKIFEQLVKRHLFIDKSFIIIKRYLYQKDSTLYLENRKYVDEILKSIENKDTTVTIPLD